MNIKSVTFDTSADTALSPQLDFPAWVGQPESIGITLTDGRDIIINGDGIVVMDEDGRTLYSGPLPMSQEAHVAAAKAAAMALFDAPAGAGDSVEADRG